MGYTNKAHAQFVAEKKAAREERRRQEEEKRRQMLEAKRKKSRNTPVKWRYPNGLKIAGVAIKNGMFYAGCNRADMIRPEIEEPSLVTPMCKVAFSELGAERMPLYPSYENISDEQRGEYLRWLASDRTEADDIGYVFMYFYGIERRLLIDTAKPGEVTDEEKEAITDEIIRLVKCFKHRSRSFYNYATLLLLYDGTFFRRNPTREEINELFELEYSEGATSSRFENAENSDAYEYLLVARLAELNEIIPDEDLVNYARLRMFRNKRTPAALANIGELTPKMLENVLKLALQRFRQSGLKKSDGHSETERINVRSGRRITPEYCPASVTLRSACVHRRIFDIDLSSVCESPETLDFEWKKISDIVVSAYNDVSAYDSMRLNKTIKGVENLKLDAVRIMCDMAGIEAAIQETLVNNPNTMIVKISASVLEKALSDNFPNISPYTSKGELSAQAQSIYSKMLASYGLQAMLPECFDDDSIARFWHIFKDSDVITFKRGVSYSPVGIQQLDYMFGIKDVKDTITLPSQWDYSVRLAYLFSWFLSSAEEEFGTDSLKSLPRDISIPPTIKEGRENQLKLHFTMMLATYSYNTSSQSLNAALEGLKFHDIQSVLFAWCQKKYGDLIPEKVLKTFEKMYDKTGHDPALVLYDYHAGDFRENYDEAPSEFTIDADRLQQTILETSEVHNILYDSFANGEEISYQHEEETQAEETVTDTEVKQPCAEQVSSNVDSAENIDDMQELADAIIELFGDDDETMTEKLKDMIKEKYSLDTLAESVAFISKVNDYWESVNGEELVEIDGEYTYLNV